MIRFSTFAGLIFMAMLCIGCTLVQKSLFHKDECEILAAKRVYKKNGKQPKIRTQLSVKSRPTSDKAVAPPTPLPTITDPGSVFSSTTPIVEIAGDVIGTVTKTGNELVNDRTHIATNKTEVECESSSDTNQIEFIPTNSGHDYSAATFFSLTGLSSILFLTLFKNRSLRFSTWASHNPSLTRGILGAIQTTTILGGYMIGYQMAADDLKIPVAVGAAAVGATVLGAIFYPKGKISLKSYTNDYLLRKYLHTLVFTGSVATIVFAGNSHYEKNGAIALAGYSLPGAFEPKKSLRFHREPVTMTEKTVAQDPPKKKNVGWKILAVVMFTALTLVTVGGACALSCEGNVVGAILLGVGAEALWIFLLNRVWRNLNGKTGKKKSSPESVPTP